MKNVGVIAVWIVLIISLLINFYLYQNNLYLYQNVNSLKSQISDTDLLKTQVSTLNSRLEVLNSKIKEYLEVEGKKCTKETQICLDELIEELNTVTGPDCSSVSDKICPKWCAAGADYDCCIEKGYEWILGRGCY